MAVSGCLKKVDDTEQQQKKLLFKSNDIKNKRFSGCLKITLRPLSAQLKYASGGDRLGRQRIASR